MVPAHDTTAHRATGRIPRILHRLEPAPPSVEADAAFDTWVRQHAGWDVVTWTSDDLRWTRHRAPGVDPRLAVLGRFGGVSVAEGVVCAGPLDRHLVDTDVAALVVDGQLLVAAAAAGQPALDELAAGHFDHALSLPTDLVSVPSGGAGRTAAALAYEQAAGLRLAVDLSEPAARPLGLAFVTRVARRFTSADPVQLAVAVRDPQRELDSVVGLVAGAIDGIADPLAIDLVAVDELGHTDLLFRPSTAPDASTRLIDALDMIDALVSRATTKA